MSDEAKIDAEAKKRAQELLANDVDERTRRFQRRGNVLIGFGVAMLIAAALLGGESLSMAVGFVGLFCALLGVRVRRALRAVAGIRAATESNAKSDHVELERQLRAELDRSPHFTLRLAMVELLAQSLWKRGAITELEELLRPYYGRTSNLGDAGPFGEAWAHVHSFALLAKAITSDEPIEEFATRIETGGALDSRIMTRLALARAIAAAKRQDATAVLRALDGFEDRATEVGSKDRALGRALRELAKRGAVGGGYRHTTSVATGGSIGAWAQKVFAPAAPFIEEQPLREIDEPAWARKPTEPPTWADIARKGKMPLTKIQVGATWIALVLIFLAGLFVMDPTVLIAFPLALLSLSSAVLALALTVKQRRDGRRDLMALRLAFRWRHEGQVGLASKKLQSVTDSRDPLACASAYNGIADIVANSGDPKTAIAMLDAGLERLAWLPSKGRETLPWGNAVLMRPRYYAMAGMEKEAESALAFALMAVIEVSAGRGMLFSTRFWLALTLHRRDEAIELARSFDVRSPIDARTELARDAVLAIGDPASQQRVRARIEAWPAAKALFERLCPWIAEGWETIATGVRVDTASDVSTESSSAESHSATSASASDEGPQRGGSTP